MINTVNAICSFNLGRRRGEQMVPEHRALGVYPAPWRYNGWLFFFNHLENHVGAKTCLISSQLKDGTCETCDENHQLYVIIKQSNIDYVDFRHCIVDYCKYDEIMYINITICRKC